MAMPKAGSRKIVVDGIRFHWRIRKRMTYGQECFYQGLSIGVEREVSPCGILLIGINDENHPRALVGKTGGAVVPADVAKWIREALKRGWDPEAKGQFALSVSHALEAGAKA